MPVLSVSIKQPYSSYNISIASGTAQKLLQTYADSGCFFVVDSNVAVLYQDIIPKKNVFVFEASEEAKNLQSVEIILNWLKDNRSLRDSKLIVIGGGITGDTAGFAAAMYMRGIRLIQMPTTLLAMVDSSVGGKTGVNLGGIKNNIGAFHQPFEVVIDTDFIDTLSYAEFLNGFAESLKISCVYGGDFFHFLKDNQDLILKREKKILEKVISKSCELKAKIVERDEKEGGLRKLLNFGHTVAHAIETDSNYSIHHGYAVAMGMVYESFYALENGYTDEKTFDLIKNAVDSFGYEATYIPKNKDIFFNAISKDKKASLSGISLALAGPELMGKIVNDIQPEDLAETVFQYMSKRR